MSRPLPPRIGPFQVLSELGRGSNGAVYLARRDGQEEVCALKLLLHADSEGQARFDLEAAISGRLLHPLIVGAIESGTHERFKWIAMEYVAGETLQDRLDRGPLPATQARRLFGDVTEALAFAHDRGVIHRDLKPANILIDAEGRAHLTDFGLARTLSSNLTRAGDMIGTPYYMSPEQLEDPTGVDARADVYALGVMLYESLAGERPFEGKTIPEVTQAKRKGICKPLASLAPQAPPDLVQACERAMALDPRDRYPTAEHFGAALGGAPGAAPAGLPHMSTLVVAAALSLALLFLVGAYARWRGLAREAEATRALEDTREALTKGDVAAARASWTRVREAGASGVLEASEFEQALLLAHEQLTAGDLGPARQLLAEPTWVGREPLRAALVSALVRQEVRRVATAPATRPDPLLELGERLLGLDDLPATAPERDMLAETCLRVALETSRERAPFRLPERLLDLAERAATDEGLRDRTRLERASYLFRRGRFQRATEVAQPLAKRPGRLGFQARYVAAFGQLWQDRYQEGLEGLKQIWLDDRDGVVGLNAGAVFHSYSGKNEIGEGFALESLKLDPSYVDAWISLTFCRNDLFGLFNSQGRQEEARLQLDRALEANEEALRLQPDHPRVWMSRAFVLANQGRVEESIQAYSSLIEVTEPRPFARALRYRAKHLAQRGDLGAAVVDLSRALERNADDIEALTWRGLFQDMQGDARAADEDWLRAARVNPRGFEQQVRSMPPQTIERIKRLFAQRQR